MSTQNPNFPPIPSDDSEDDPATKQVDDKPVLDPDADPDLIDSIDADRLAAENGDDPDQS